MQDLGYIPNQLIQGGGLPAHTVDIQRDRQRVQRIQLGRRQQCTDRRGVIKTLAGIPRQTLGFGCCLQIAAGQIQTYAKAEHQAHGSSWRQYAGRGITAQRHHQLHFVMQVTGTRRVWHHTIGDDGIGRLHEECGGAAFGFGRGRNGAHFASVVGKIAAHAVDAAHRKTAQLGAAAIAHRNARRRGCRDHVHQWVSCALPTTR